MSPNEFKDRLFDILNETDHLTIKDIVVEDTANIIKIYLSDRSVFIIHCDRCRA